MGWRNPEKGPEDAPVEHWCPDCGGRGYVKDQNDPQGGQKKCERCNGTGRIFGR